MTTSTGVIALVFALTFGMSDLALAAQTGAVPAARERAPGGPPVATALAQACRDRGPGVIVTVAGTRTACPAPTGRFFNTCEECNAACPGPCFLTSASNCQCMLDHVPTD